MTDNANLNTWAALFDDQQNTRMALGLRIGAMKKQPGRWNPLIGAPLEEALDATRKLEGLAERRLAAAVKAHPLGPFITATSGLGHASIGRLLSEIDDPAWHRAENRPRTLDELYAYTGMAVVDGVAPARRRGQQGNWNENARKWVAVIADRCIMQDGKEDKNGNPRARSPYRDLYDEARAKYDNAVHTQPCPRCGSKREIQEDGRVKQNVPAPVGSPLSKNHQHARARRIVAKRILEDLWRADLDAQSASIKDAITY